LEWAVYTVAFRKVLQARQSINDTCTVHWDLKDQWGKPLANGLYYLKAKISGATNLEKIRKLIVMR
jgi:hypothetical protein